MAYVMSKNGKNGKKWPKIITNGQKWAKMVAKNQVGQRVGHTEMPKKSNFANLLPIFSSTPVNLRSIVTKDIKHSPTKSEY